MRLTRIVSIAGLCSLLVLASACSGSASRDSSSTKTTTTIDNGKVVSASGPIALEVGERATIELEANPTTGFQWAFAAEPDDAVVRVISDTYVAPATAAVGTGGQQTIVIEGVAAGSTTIELAYGRPWEADVAPAKSTSFAVTVG